MGFRTSFISQLFSRVPVGTLKSRATALVLGLTLVAFQAATTRGIALPSGEAGSPQKALLQELNSGEQIAVMGSAAAKALFDDGHLTALIKGAFPERRLRFSNFALAGESLLCSDAEKAARRERLREEAPDVVLAFFGAVESAAGSGGVALFQEELTSFVKSVGEGRSSGGGRPRLVLFGPAGRDGLFDPAPDSAQREAQLRSYSEAVAAVAERGGVPFFDLYASSRRMFANSAQRSALLPKRWGTPVSALSVHGGFLTSEANRLLAQAVFEGLFGRQPPEVPSVPSKPASTGQAATPAASVQEGGELPFRPAAGFKADLFADQSFFPELRQPVQVEWDVKGRLWVLCLAEDAATGSLLVLEDINGDGRADRCTTFADALPLASGFVCFKDGVIVQTAGELWLLRDTRGGARVNERQRLLSGLTAKGARPFRQGMQMDAKGGIILHEPGSERGFIETGLGRAPARGGMFRFEPSTGKLDVLLEGPVQGGLCSVLDAWGRDAALQGRTHPKSLQRLIPGTVTGALFLEGSSFPAPWRGRLLLASGAAGVKSMALLRDGTLPQWEEAADFAPPSSPEFHPTALGMAPDGTLTLAEGQGARCRIYRIGPENQPPQEVQHLAGTDLGGLLDLLKTDEPALKQRVRHEVSMRPSSEALAELNSWVRTLDKKGGAYDRLALEALWLGRWFDVPGEFYGRPLLENVLKSGDPRARAEAVRVVREIGSALPDALALLEPLSIDVDSVVRLEVLAVARLFPEYTPDAIRLVHRVLALPVDESLRAAAGEALGRLEPDSARMLVPAEPVALGFVLGRLSNAELANAPGVEPVWEAQIDRPEMEESLREAALQSLAKARGTSRVQQIFAAMSRAEASGPSAVPLEEMLARLAFQSPLAELGASLAALEKFALSSPSPGVRALACGALLRSAPKPEDLWNRFGKTPSLQKELLAALPVVMQMGLGQTLHDSLARILSADGVVADEWVRAAVKALPLAGQVNAREDFDSLAGLILKRRFVPEAGQAILQLSPTALGGVRVAELGSLGPLVSVLLGWLEGRSPGERGSGESEAVLTLCSQLVERMQAQALEVSSRLRGMK